jgi:hypothetical protein
MSLVKHPSAWLPLALSLAALAVIGVHVAVAGLDPQPDEGTAAHLWQLLMAAQVPAIAFFALRWLPQRPAAALLVLALQSAAMIAAMAPVYLLRW